MDNEFDGLEVFGDTGPVVLPPSLGLGLTFRPVKSDNAGPVRLPAVVSQNHELARALVEARGEIASLREQLAEAREIVNDLAALIYRHIKAGGTLEGAETPNGGDDGQSA